MYIETNNCEQQQRNMCKGNQTTRRPTKQDNLTIPSPPRVRSDSTGHRRSSSVDMNLKKINNKNNNKQNTSKRLSPLTPISLLCYTVVHRDEILLQKLLTNYPSEVDKLSEEGVSPLHLASMDGNIEIMKILLQNGATIDSCDFNNRSALEYAVLSGQFDAAQFLIENGCDSTLIRDGYSALF